MMFRWIAENKEWLFSGGGVVLLGALWWLTKTGYSRWKQGRDVADLNGVSRHVQYERIMRKGLLDKLPSFILRAMVKPEQIASRINVDLRGDTPIGLTLNAEVPHLEMYFEITNLSQFDLVLDRMLVEVWFGQPTFTSVILKRYLVPGGEITRNIFIRQTLTLEQRNQIESFEKPDHNRGFIHIRLTAYFESPLGSFEVAKDIERRKA